MLGYDTETSLKRESTLIPPKSAQSLHLLLRHLDLLKAGCSTVGLFINPSFSIQEFNAVKSKASFVKTVMLLITVKRKTMGRAQGRQLSSIFASSSMRGMPVKGGTAACPQAGEGQGEGHRGRAPGEGLRLVWSLTKLKSGWMFLCVWILRWTTYSFTLLQYTYQIIWYITHDLLK